MEGSRALELGTVGSLGTQVSPSGTSDFSSSLVREGDCFI